MRLASGLPTATSAVDSRNDTQAGKPVVAACSTGPGGDRSKNVLLHERRRPRQARVHFRLNEHGTGQ
jgi:hypothetical protein